jgi:hypothetical protein
MYHPYYNDIWKYNVVIIFLSSPVTDSTQVQLNDAKNVPKPKSGNQFDISTILKGLPRILRALVCFAKEWNRLLSFPISTPFGWFLCTWFYKCKRGALFAIYYRAGKHDELLPHIFDKLVIEMVANRTPPSSSNQIWPLFVLIGTNKKSDVIVLIPM